MIFFAGDPHGHFNPLLRVVALAHPHAVILLGDYDLPVPLDEALLPILDQTEIAWIPGNHDGDRDEWYDRLFGSSLAPANLNGCVRTIGGVRVAGLGGVFREGIWHPGATDPAPRYKTREACLRATPRQNWWRGGLPRKHRVSIFWEDYERLWDKRADILVCHEAPSTHRHGFAVLEELAQSLQASLIVHGHHHTDYAAVTPSGIRVLGVGLAGVTDESGRIWAPGRVSAGRRQAEASKQPLVGSVRLT